MNRGFDLQSGDRLLLLEIPTIDEVRAMSARLAEGLIVALAAEESVRLARRALADLDNVMIVPAEPGQEIPWRDRFFTKIVAPSAREATPEMLRVLAPGGYVYLEADVVGPVT